MIHGLPKNAPLPAQSTVHSPQSTVNSSGKPNKLAKFIANSPRLVKHLKRYRRPADRGLGDTVARMAGGTNGKRFAAWFAARVGQLCGCADAQTWLNRNFPH
jgi:hypothetical protein